MTYLKENKKKAEEYRRLELADWELKSSIKNVREVLSLRDMANVLKQTLDKAEIESLIKELQ